MDHIYHRTHALLPSAVDLAVQREAAMMPKAWSQGELRACVANAVAAAWSYTVARQSGELPKTPSRLFIYYEGRRIEQDAVDCGDGMRIRDAFKALTRSGVPAEDVWPYDASKCAVEPPDEVYAAAKPIAPIEYFTISSDHPPDEPSDRVGAIKEVLASGFPVAFGFFVEYDLEIAASTGIVDLSPEGYGDTGTPPNHAALIIGYDDDDDGGRFKVRNSSGSTWGDGHGNFRMAYDYVETYGHDFWFIKHIVVQEET